jgi:hypothetical protein
VCLLIPRKVEISFVEAFGRGRKHKTNAETPKRDICATKSLGLLHIRDIFSWRRILVQKCHQRHPLQEKRVEVAVAGAEDEEVGGKEAIEEEDPIMPADDPPKAAELAMHPHLAAMALLMGRMPQAAQSLCFYQS